MANTIRIADRADGAAIAAIYGPYCDSSPISFDVAAPTADQMSERIERIGERYPWLVCELGGQVAGYVYASQHRERAAYRWTVEVAVYIDSRRHRRGIGRTLYTSLFAILRKQNYFKAYAGITLPNPASIGLHEAVGFTPVGRYPGVGYKLGRWLDVGWWQLALRPEIADPPEPLPFSAIRDGDAVRRALLAGAKLLQPAESH
jgi:phosphinothricin acetyltransferase